jgi:N-methylhydantoinase A
VALSDPLTPSPQADPRDAKPSATTRPCFFGDSAPVGVPIFKAENLVRGSRIPGPAIIEETTTTLVVYPEMAVSISGNGHYLLEIA